MTLGVEVRTRTAPSSRGASTDTGTAFVAVQAGAGPLDAPTLIRSVGDFASVYNARETANEASYDWLDAYFREGGQRAYVGRYTDVGGLSSALGLFGEELGPGQIVAPEETAGAATYDALRTHAAANNRFAVLDVANDDTVAAMNTLGAAGTGDASYSMVVGPWLTIPGPAGVIGAGAREVPASAAAAALMARVDGRGNPNVAAAGRDYPLQYANGFVRRFTAADADVALDNGYNLFIDKYGVLELYGFQTGVDQDPDDPFWQANCARARMWLTAQAKNIGEGFMFKPIDGQGRLANALKQAIEGVCLDLYNANGLFGDTPADAFSVEAGQSVNTIETIAQGELHAAAEVRLSLHAKSVLIDLVSVPVTGSVSQPA